MIKTWVERIDYIRNNGDYTRHLVMLSGCHRLGRDATVWHWGDRVSSVGPIGGSP